MSTEERAGSPVSAGAVDLSWVDRFIAEIRPYVHVRTRDAVLIKMPNQAFRLNGTGVRIMRFLLEGGEVAGLLRATGRDKADEVAGFLVAVRRALAGKLRETDACSAVEVRPLGVNFSGLPVLAEVALTGRCNLRCVFCYAGCPCSDGTGSAGGEMSRAEVKLVIDRIRDEAEVPSLSFTGGEPTLREDLPELVAYAAHIKGMRVNLITNGTLVTPQLVEELQRSGLASAQVSIEGINASTHDSVTGVSGSFERSIAAIRQLDVAGIPVHANTTINRINLEECAGLPRLAADLGLARFSMNLIIPSGSAARNSEQLLRYEDLGPVLEEVMAVSADAGVEFMWYSPTPLCMFNPIVHGLGNKGCSACDGLLSVDSAGSLLPCSSCPDPVGSLLEESFDDLWTSSKARFYRAKSFAYPRCRECDNFAACHGACPLYWDYFGFEELERGGFLSRGLNNRAERQALSAAAAQGREGGAYDG